MRTIALTNTPQIEVVSPYSTSNQQVPAVNADSAWLVVGSFYIPITMLARLEAIGLVVAPATRMSIRLFDMGGAEPVQGTVFNIDTSVDSRGVSGRVELRGGRIYQFQAQVLGLDGFGLLKSACLV